MVDTRRDNRRLFEVLSFSYGRDLLKVLGCLLSALVFGLLPEYQGLSEAGHWALAILILAAGLWITEAIPAFSVALLIIGLEIVILGAPGGPFAGAEETTKWRIFIEPWASPLIWLFLGGFILAAAAAKTGLDKALAHAVLKWAGTRPRYVLLASMGITFVLSMFMSNTATAAMMLTVIAPLSMSLPTSDRFRVGLILGVAFSANLGGMGTIIGTPPNAIAAGILAQTQPIEFLSWMLIGLPPALLLLGVLWLYLLRRFPCSQSMITLDSVPYAAAKSVSAPLWQRLLVVVVFIITVGLWMVGSLRHSSPTAVIAFIPITALSISGIIGIREIRNLPWDVLILLTGGLSLGVAVTETGLSDWLVSLLPLEGVGFLGVVLLFAYFTSALSNFMSNTGAANILIPIGFASALSLGNGDSAPTLVISIALAASTAMCLPIATPPNAIAFSSGHVRTYHFIEAGLLIGLIAPAISVAWCLSIIGVL